MGVNWFVLLVLFRVLLFLGEFVSGIKLICFNCLGFLRKIHFLKNSENLKIFLCKIQPKCGIIKHKDDYNERERHDK